MAKAEHADVVAGADLVERVEKLIRLAEGVMARCIAERDNKTTFVGIRESARLIDLLGRLKGELDSSTTVNVQVNVLQTPEWLVIKQALGGYPEARAAVAEALAALGQQAALPMPADTR